MYVKAYQDLSLKSLVCCSWFFRPVHLGAWLGGSWLPFFVASAFRPVWPGRCDLSFICIPQSTRALDQGGIEPRQAVSPKALRPWTIPLRYSVGSGGFLVAVAGCAPLLCCCSCLVHRDFRWNGSIFRFTFSLAQWASSQLNGPVQHFSDRDS